MNTMDIRSVSDKEKMEFIRKAHAIFVQIRGMLATLEIDIQKEDLKIQASAVWITGNLCNWFNDFMEQLRMLEKQKNDIQAKLMDAANEETINEQV
jgi:hypothetical protein